VSFNDSLIETLSYLTMSEEDFERRIRLRSIKEKLEDLKQSAKFNKEQWEENLAAGFEDTENRELKYKSALKEMRAIRKEIKKLLGENK
jgi:hypothetical protein